MFRSAVFVALLVCTVLSAKVESLPDYSGPPLSMYSGYIEVPGTGRFMHYWLVETLVNPEDAPLVVWTNGGPGCSGLAGLMSENGPLRIDSAGNVVYATPTWTQVANVLFIEQPAGVGFSYYTNPADVNTNDDKAASDNLALLSGFLKEFPQYVGRSTWLTAESYGGVYIPQLAALILSQPSTDLAKQLAGFMVGNPVFNCQGNIDSAGGAFGVEEFNLLYWHGLASYRHYANWTAHDCNNKFAKDKACPAILAVATAEVGVINQPTKRSVERDNFPSLNPDCIYYDFCSGNGSLDFSSETGECNSIDNRIKNYLNRADVKKALHVKSDIAWDECTTNLNYTIQGRNMLDFYDKIFAAKPSMKVLVYSGDIDILTVPFAFTMPCIYQMGKTRVSNWQPWFVNGATAGYVEEFARFTYATIKGAGHEAPTFQPLNSYEMFSRFLLKGQLVDDAHRPDPARFSSRRRRQSDNLRYYNVLP